MPNPFFSVIVPTYNRASFIHIAIQSVIQQSFTDWELILIDDGSTDNTKGVVADFKDERIIYFYQENKERSAARNKGIELSSGTYICFLDSDDYYLENHLFLFYCKIKNENFPVSMLYCNAFEDTDGKFLKIKNSINVSEYKKLKNVFLFPIALCKVCISKEIVEKHKFNEKYRIGEDMDLWIRVLKEYPLFHNDDYTIVIKIHQGRTVINEEIQARKQNLFLAKKITYENRSHFTFNERMKIISTCYFSLSKTYYLRNIFLKMLFSIIMSFLYSPFDKKNKEKIFMIYSSLKNKI